MAKSSRAYRSAKRSRELDRLRKQEEKRLRRQHKAGLPAEGEGTEGGGLTAEGGGEAETPSAPGTDDSGEEPA